MHILLLNFQIEIHPFDVEIIFIAAFYYICLFCTLSWKYFQLKSSQYNIEGV